MAHKEQLDFVNKTKSKYPQYFENVQVLDIGSLDINGNNKTHFNNCEYIGIDLAEGKNVDVVCSGHLYKSDELFDTIISTEALEHDINYIETVKNALSLLKPNGLYIMTCASTGRPEHGTARTNRGDCPFTADSNYYKNLMFDDLKEILEDGLNEIYHEYNSTAHDLYVYGMKK